MFNFDLERLLYVIPAIILALSIHEYSHARTAYAFGDPTAKAAGRMTLNPLKHLDPIGTLLLVFAGFGWAKPVPVNPMYFEGSQKRKMLSVSLAGPASNLIQALLGTGLLAIVYHLIPYSEISNYFFLFFCYYISINIVLAIFNILPIPPLDGSKILAGLLPDRCYNFMMNLERYGFIILLVVVFIPNILTRLGLPTIDILGTIIGTPANFLYNLLLGIVI